jgi:hypothetical protein
MTNDIKAIVIESFIHNQKHKDMKDNEKDLDPKKDPLASKDSSTKSNNPSTVSKNYGGAAELEETKEEEEPEKDKDKDEDTGDEKRIRKTHIVEGDSQNQDSRNKTVTDKPENPQGQHT